MFDLKRFLLPESKEIKLERLVQSHGSFLNILECLANSSPKERETFLTPFQSEKNTKKTGRPSKNKLEKIKWYFEIEEIKKQVEERLNKKLSVAEFLEELYKYKELENYITLSEWRKNYSAIRTRISRAKSLLTAKDVVS